MKFGLRWLQYALFALALALLGAFVSDKALSWMFQRRADAELASGRHAVRIEAGDVIGRVEVDRLGVSVAVVEGANEGDLQHAAGHVTGTAFPGQPGNVAIAAHRDTFFRPLRNIRPTDVIRVTTPDGEYRYRVISTRIVAPDDVTVLRPGRGQELTLITCYPFYFVGSAPERFIVQARRVPDPDERRGVQPIASARHL